MPAMLLVFSFQRKVGMTIQFSGNNGTFQSQQASSAMNPSDASSLNQMSQIKSEALQQELWAAAQGLALAKLKVYHSMAKSVNDQQ